MQLALALVERGLVPDFLVRRGIKKLCEQRLQDQADTFGQGGDAELESGLTRWLQHMRSAEVAPLPEKANEQHYEVPPAFFQLALGPRLKYSSCWFEGDSHDLGHAEDAMLALTCERARLANGQQILELGCGWGSLTLWMAEAYPAATITAVSNSAHQRKFIETRAKKRGLDNIRVLTRDMNVFQPREAAPEGGFDRVVTVEMFEHMRNWEDLLGRVRSALSDDGLMFAHVFAHNKYAYAFEVQDDSDWMSKYFFSGGQMPSDDQFTRVDAPFAREDHWVVDGTHYALTAEAWLRNVDEKREACLAALRPTYGKDTAMWLRRWRVFFMACAELFNYRAGQEWWVTHELMRPLPVEQRETVGAGR